jgi:hypothetical protein
MPDMPATGIVGIGNLRHLKYDHPQHHGRKCGLDIKKPNFDEISRKKKGEKGVKRCTKNVSEMKREPRRTSGSERSGGNRARVVTVPPHFFHDMHEKQRMCGNPPKKDAIYNKNEPRIRRINWPNIGQISIYFRNKGESLLHQTLF